MVNLDGLFVFVLEKLFLLLKLWDVFYSKDFWEWIFIVFGVGFVLGKKIDMVVNVYVLGCYLFCYDDVIGSWWVSYILYLIDLDKLWKVEWGGVLWLYFVNEKKGSDGKIYNVL